jgi:phosphatidylethanolamine-binding protein (PEBP) family uncharacterized protein
MLFPTGDRTMVFVLRSPNFNEQETLPQEQVHHAMGAGGKNVSPELTWSGAPAGTKSFALTMTLYALNTEKLDVPDEASAAYVGSMIHFAKRRS